MKHIWVVESSGGRKWRPAGAMLPISFFTKRMAKREVRRMKHESPGLKWRAAKYARVGR